MELYGAFDARCVEGISEEENIQRVLKVLFI